MANVTIKLDEKNVLHNGDLGWMYRLINMKISELSSTRSDPAPGHAQREADELRSLSSKLWAIDSAMSSRKVSR